MPVFGNRFPFSFLGENGVRVLNQSMFGRRCVEPIAVNGVVLLIVEHGFPIVPALDHMQRLILLHALACTGLLTWYPAIRYWT